MKTAKEIKNLWINFFKSKNHLFLKSKPLVPENDNSILWVNSGVATLKDYFSGKKIPPATRLVNCQKALRTNDLENVGITSRHHTFFEMLGNFSIGDYHKKEAIEMADEFLIKILKFSREKLFITYFKDDLETKNIWLKLGYKESHLIPGSKKTNFWDMGQGPCGPNTEIFYDRGPKFDTRDHNLIKLDIENDRFIEIWNIVFSEFNNLGNGKYEPLKFKNIDTGAGLERIVAILQKVPTNFDSDLFLPIIKEIEKFTPQLKYKPENYFLQNDKQKKINTAFKVIADHMRAIVMLILDGVFPSNSKRGYIIRKLIRRAFYEGKKLYIQDIYFLSKLVKVVVAVLDVDPTKINQVEKEIQKEENNFAEVLRKGKVYVLKKIQEKNLDINKFIFESFETHGIPIELTTEILSENNIFYDLNKVNDLLQKHAEISKSMQGKGMNKIVFSDKFISEKISNFFGYQIQKIKTKIIKIFDQNQELESLSDEQKGYVVLQCTPFYATAGGQKHDVGFLLQKENKVEVLNVFKDKFGNNIHEVKGKINKNEEVEAFVNLEIRKKNSVNHSCTHLLFKALRKIFPDQKIIQLGSDIDERRFTFDFSLVKKATEQEIKKIEKLVNFFIQKNVPRFYYETTVSHAKAKKAIMTIEESNYSNFHKVRMVEFPGITTDLCGGTHVNFTGEIEVFKITNFINKGSKVYRIRAITLQKNYLEFFNEKILVLKKDLKKLIGKDHDFFFQKKEFKNKEEEWNFYLEKIKEIKKTIKKNITNSILLQRKIKNIYFFETENYYEIQKLAAQKREENPEEIIIFFSKKEKAIIVTSKHKKVKKIFDYILEKYSGKGGGNQFFCQGKIDQNFDIEKIKKWEEF